MPRSIMLTPYLLLFSLLLAVAAFTDAVVADDLPAFDRYWYMVVSTAISGALSTVLANFLGIV